MINKLRWRRTETRTTADDAAASISLRRIGVVRSSLHDLRFKDTAAQPAVLEIDERYRVALTGLDGFSHLIVVTWLDRVSEDERAMLTIQTGAGHALRQVGVLALRTHHRPNPLGLTVVRLDAVQGGQVHVTGMDVIDGTPVLDLKPYLPSYDSVPHATRPAWASGVEARP